MGTGQQETMYDEQQSRIRRINKVGVAIKNLITVEIALLTFSSLLCDTIIGGLTSKTVVMKGNPGNIYSLSAV